MTDYARDQASADLLSALATAAKALRAEQPDLMRALAKIRLAVRAFDAYRIADPRTVTVREPGRTVCLHCGQPYEEVQP